jgi:hypothetical protein
MGPHTHLDLSFYLLKGGGALFRYHSGSLFRCHSQNGAKEPLLDEPALEAVHQVSFGIPRKIGALVEQALTFAMFDHKRTITAEMVLKVKNLEG